MMDIERDRRYVPYDKFDKLASLLRLSSEGKHILMDLTSFIRLDTVSAALQPYIMGNDLARVVLRKTIACSLSDDAWQEVIDFINKKELSRINVYKLLSQYKIHTKQQKNKATKI
jgi:hypothetical protein